MSNEDTCKELLKHLVGEEGEEFMSNAGADHLERSKDQQEMIQETKGVQYREQMFHEQGEELIWYEEGYVGDEKQGSFDASVMMARGIPQVEPRTGTVGS